MEISDEITLEVDRRWWYHAWVDSFEMFANRYTGSDGWIYWSMSISCDGDQKHCLASENGLRNAFEWSNFSGSSRIFDQGAASDLSDEEREPFIKHLTAGKKN